MADQKYFASYGVNGFNKFKKTIEPDFFTPPIAREITTNHPICGLYDQVFRKDPLYSDTHLFSANIGIRLRGIDAGTLFKPKLEVLLGESRPSSFGRGEETVYDEKVRLGREILAKDLAFTNESDFKADLQNLLGKLRKDFLPNEVLMLVLYKMAIYEKGGHFKTHKDTPMSRCHVATLLLEIKSYHEGGMLKFNFGKHEKSVILKNTTKDQLSYCVFFTDIDHAVEPLLSGCRIVLQFCVYAADRGICDLPQVDDNIFHILMNADIQDTRLDKRAESAVAAAASVGGDGVEVYAGETIKPQDVFARLYKQFDWRNNHKRIDGHYDELLFPNFKVFGEIEEILNQHDFNQNWLALPAWHLYLDGISVSLLKGVDREFYQYFSAKFIIDVIPVIFFKRKPYDLPTSEEDVFYFTLEDIRTSKNKQRLPNILTLAPKNMKAEMIYHQDARSWMGNEPQAEEDTYFAAMLLFKGVVVNKH